LLGNIGRKRPHTSILRTPTAISQPTMITETYKSGGFWPINEIVLLPGSEATSGGFAATRRVESPMYAVRTGVVTGSAVRSGAIVGTVKPQWITLLPVGQSLPCCPSTYSVLPCINHLSRKHWCPVRWDATCNRPLQRHPFVKLATFDKLQSGRRATAPHNRPKNR
jgi:hypothetical protein